MRLTADMEHGQALEAFVDRYGLSEVLSVLVEVCHGKAEHLRSNWQDNIAAREWEQAAKAIDTASSKVRV